MVSRFRLARSIPDSDLSCGKPFLSSTSLPFVHMDSISAKESFLVPLSQSCRRGMPFSYVLHLRAWILSLSGPSWRIMRPPSATNQEPVVPGDAVVAEVATSLLQAEKTVTAAPVSI